MVKVLFAPLNYGDIFQEGVYDAFRQAGCTLKVFDYFQVNGKENNTKKTRSKFIDEALQFKPDLIHLQIQHTNIIDAQTVAAVRNNLPKTIIVNWTGDVRNYVPVTCRRIAAEADFNLISSTGQIDLFKKIIQKPIKYWQIGYNPKLYYRDTLSRAGFEFDCVFIGNHNTVEKYPGAAQRIKACQLLRRKFGNRFGLFGHGWPKDLGTRESIDQKRASSIYHRSLCSISISHYNDLQHYFSDRLLMCLASGRPTVSMRFPGWQSYFTNMCDLVIAESIDDIPHKVDMLKGNLQLAEFIGQSGAAKAFAEHTYYSRVVRSEEH